jgi:hypothetical protein
MFPGYKYTCLIPTTSASLFASYSLAMAPWHSYLARAALAKCHQGGSKERRMYSDSYLFSLFSYSVAQYEACGIEQISGGHILHHPELDHHDLQITPSCIFCCSLDASFITRKETDLESSFLIRDIILLGLYKFKKKHVKRNLLDMLAKSLLFQTKHACLILFHGGLWIIANMGIKPEFFIDHMILVTNLNNPQEPIHDWSMKQIIREIDCKRNNINRSFWHIPIDIKIVPKYK